MATNGKSPDEWQRSKLRNDLKNLLADRSQTLSEINSINEFLDPEYMEFNINFENNSINSDLGALGELSDKELESKFKSELFYAQTGRFNWLSAYGQTELCIWFGRGDKYGIPVTGAYGCAPKNFSGYLKTINRWKGVCESSRIPLDVYCVEHRLKADQAIQSGVPNEIFVKTSISWCPEVNVSPLKSVDSDLIRKELALQIKNRKGKAKAEIKNQKAELTKLKKRLVAIDKKLALHQDSLARLESGLKRQRFPENIRLTVYKKYDFKCAICEVDLTLIKPHIDHIKPLSKGGKDIISNLQPLCEPCNLRKGSKFEE